MHHTTRVRLALRSKGFNPIPCVGKRPSLDGWPNKINVSEEEITSWQPGNTGILCANDPCLDIDVGAAVPADAIQERIHEFCADLGEDFKVLVRYGNAPRFAVPFRTNTPFSKIVRTLVAPDGTTHKIEFLGNGQQYIVDGFHPDTGKAYGWQGDVPPWMIARDDIPLVNEAQARQLLDGIVMLLVEEFNYTEADNVVQFRAGERPSGTADGPIDAHAMLAAMRYKGGNVNGINYTLNKVIGHLLNFEHPDDVLKLTVKEVMRVAAEAGESWTQEEIEEEHIKRIHSMYKNMLKDYDPSSGEVPHWLHGDFHKNWIAALMDGKSPGFSRNESGFFARGWGPYKKTEEQRRQNGEEASSPRPGGAVRFNLVPFAGLRPGPEPLYLVDELIPAAGLVDVWGKAKCCKSFFVLDLMLHVAMGWEYRDRYVSQGTVVYCAFEGAHGYKKRIEALRRTYNIEDESQVPLYVMPGQANLVKDHICLIRDFRAQLGEINPAVVVLDTLNKSLHGSENKDTDMGDYVRAAEAVRDAFKCVVIIVHHCGYDTSRPRGHSSLPAAVDAQLAVERDGEIITVTVEMMRDGPEDTQVVSRTQSVDVGEDQRGKPLTSLVLIPADDSEASVGGRQGWSRGLTLFHAALRYALKDHKEAFQTSVGEIPVDAVELEFIRERFYETYTDPEEDEKKRQEKIRKAFNRAFYDAKDKDIVATQRTPTKRQMVWFRGHK